MAQKSTSLWSKFVFVAGLSVIVGAALGIVASIRAIDQLSRRSTEEIDHSIRESSDELLRKQVHETERAAARVIDPAVADLHLLGDVGQRIIDHREEYGELFAALERTADIHHPLDLRPELGARESPPGRGSVVLVFGYLLDEKGDFKPGIHEEVIKTDLLGMIFEPLQRRDPSRVQVYYVGPPSSPYVRLAPYYPVLERISKKDAPGLGKPFWSYWFPGMVEAWQRLPASKADFAARSQEIVYTPIYDDAFGGGLIVSLFQPLWTKDRTAFNGVVAIDLKVAEIIHSIENVKVAKTGFAFLVQSDGNVAAINDAGNKAMALQTAGTAQGQGVDLQVRNLAKSSEPDVVRIAGALPSDDAVHYSEITLAGEPFVLALHRYSKLALWVGDAGIKPDQWTFGLVAPKREIFAAVAASQAAIAESKRSIVLTQVLITLATVLAVLLGVAIVSRRITAPLTRLTQGARELGQRNYDLVVEASSNDEVGELAGAFNKMASEIREHTQNLEGIVKSRTEDLDRALKELWSEVDLAEKVQTVLLPSDEVLSGYDVGVIMRPASNVGGDYYDFFRAGDSQWLLIGDVSGHGITAGLIMMMAQTSIRTAAQSLATGGAPLAPSRLLATVNAGIRRNLRKIGKSQYMTLSAFRLDGDTLTFAGLHQDILVYRAASRKVEAIETSGIWIGILDDIEPLLENATLTLGEDDVALLYTDGLTEAKVGGRMIGVETLQRVFQQIAPTCKSSEEVVQAVLREAAVETFHDDVTLLAIRRGQARVGLFRREET